VSEILSATAMAISVSAPVALYLVYRKMEQRKTAEIVELVKREVSSLRKEVSSIGTADSDTNIGEALKKIAYIEERLGILEKRIAEVEGVIDNHQQAVDNGSTAEEAEEDIARKVVELRKQGYSLRRIAEELKVSVSRVRRIIKERGGS